MTARQVGTRSITLGDGTATGPAALGLTGYVQGLLDDGDPARAPVTAWLPALTPAPLTVARIEAADDATPLAWQVVPESIVPSTA